MIITEEKRKEFNNLFQEFINSYPLTPDGLRHLSIYNQQRKQGKSNFETVIKALESQENITDLVLLKLLPYTDSETNQNRGAWIHIAPALATDVRIKFEAANWTKPEDWDLIAKAIFELINLCNLYPEKLPESCLKFTQLPYSKGFQAGILTPILNALNPDYFLLINNKSRKVINYFTDHNYSQKIIDYPAINQTAFQLIDNVKDILVKANLPALRIDDIFDMFCHWLVAIKKFEFLDMIKKNKESYFTEETFELLNKLHHNSTKEFYKEYEEDFKKYVENPFKALFSYVASQLPSAITNLMETEKRLFSRILKNDYGKGETWDFFWGAFYTKGGKRIEDAQLFLFLNYETLEFGFYIGQYGSQQRTNFVKFCQENKAYITELVKDIYDHDQNIYLGNRDNYYLNENQEILSKKNITLESWLNNIAQEDRHLAVILPCYKVLNYDQAELSDYIISIYQKLFSLVLITVYDDPIPVINQYLESLENKKNLLLDDDLTMMKDYNFWWVNQGSSYELNKDFQFLWSPQQAKDGRKFTFWDNMKLVETNNIIFHYSKGEIIGISKAIHPVIMAKRPQTLSTLGNWEEEGYLLPIKYEEIKAKILLNAIPLDLRQQDLKGSPFNKNGEINQGYLYPISDNLGNYLLEKIDDKLMENKEISATIETETNIKIINPEYTLENLTQDTYIPSEKLETIIKAIQRKKQIILQGSPGTGKTFLAEKLAQFLISNRDGFAELIQFHPSYSYEDFIQGLRPITNNGILEYKMIKGRFLDFCERAEKCTGICVLIIDEINRGNLASIFGELMYLLEYREQKIKLAGSNQAFSIPQNVRIIGTMNTADRSIALVDHALRRRFSFITLKPDYQILKTYHQETTGLNIQELIKILKNLNQQIDDPHYELGISYFLTRELLENIADIWLMEIEPYLEEYFFDDLDKINDFRWQNIQEKIIELI